MAGASLRFLLSSLPPSLPLPPFFSFLQEALDILLATWASCGKQFIWPNPHMSPSSLIPVDIIHSVICTHVDIYQVPSVKLSYWVLEMRSPRVEVRLTLLGDYVRCPGYRVWNQRTLHYVKCWFVRHPPRPFTYVALICCLFEVRLNCIGIVAWTYFPFHIEKQ